MRIPFEEALHFSLRCKMPRRIPFKCGLHDRAENHIGNKNLAAPTWCRHVAITNRCAENPKPALNTRLHLLDNLTPVLFALKFSLSSDHRLNELAFGCILDAEVQTLNGSAALHELAAQLQVKLCVTREAFQIVEYDDVRLAPLCIEIAEQRDHARTLHEVTAAAHIIREHRFNRVPFFDGISTAALFLTFKTATFDTLLSRSYTAVNYCHRRH
ncbi:MAG: hypothetical protein U1D69_02830 [Polynucleobacter sp.]|nr:hypothetical protein [Polynucleobacter sp.]